MATASPSPEPTLAACRDDIQLSPEFREQLHCYLLKMDYMGYLRFEYPA